MKTRIQSVHFDADHKLTDFINDRMDKLNHLYAGIVGFDVILKLEKSSNSENKIAEIRVEIKGNDLFAKKQCSSFEEAVDQCSAALKPQIEKYKGKFKRQ